MNYFVAAAILKMFSLNSQTQDLYRYLTNLKHPEKPIDHDRSMWLLGGLKDISAAPLRVLEIGTGWVHAYSIYPALLRNDEIHCFDIVDLRYPLPYFQNAVVRAAEQIYKSQQFSPVETLTVKNRVNNVLAASSYAEAYLGLGMTYHTKSTRLVGPR